MLHEYRQFHGQHKNKWYFSRHCERLWNKDFDTLSYELDRPLLKAKDKNVIGLMKDNSSGKIMM